MLIFWLGASVVGLRAQRRVLFDPVAPVIALVISVLAMAEVRAADLPMPLQQVSARTYFVEGQTALGSPENQNFISNAGFVITETSVVVIDALGSPALAERLLTEIRRVTPKPVSHVLVTHYHADHVYGLQVFKKAGATIVAQRSAWAYLGSETAQLRLEASRHDLAPYVDKNTRLVPADRWLEGDDALVIGGVEFRMTAVGPSHTPEDMVIYVPQERVVFTGDIVFQGRIPFVGQADSRHWIVALDKLINIEASTMLPGHGPVSHRPDEDIQLTREYLLFLRNTMGEAAQNLEPFEEAYRKADWSRFKNLPLFGAANRINAFNTYLLMEQEKD
jgi:glyoxylase-like metal-dependent hydrolase (beta-lactamase superfamily II)